MQALISHKNEDDEQTNRQKGEFSTKHYSEYGLLKIGQQSEN
jgi:hypothetical protein